MYLNSAMTPHCRTSGGSDNYYAVRVCDCAMRLYVPVLTSLANDKVRGGKNQGIMLAAARKEVIRARTILKDSRLQFDKTAPCVHCHTVREEMIEKQIGSSKEKGEPGPLVKVLRMAPKRCRACKEARKKFGGFSNKKDQELVSQAEEMAKQVLAFTEADDDDLATKEKKLEDFEKKKKLAVTARDFDAANAIHASMEEILGG